MDDLEPMSSHAFESRMDHPRPASWTTRRLLGLLLPLSVLAVAFGFFAGRDDGEPAGRSYAATATGSAAGDAESELVPVLVELFTSEGCSSCPPADRLLAEFDETQPFPGVLVVPMSEHVDYWNRLGWTDPFSSAEFSRRQNDYARSIGSRRIYTPQMVVDGRFQFVGSKESQAREAILDASMAPKADVTLRPCADPGSAENGGHVGHANHCVEIRVGDVPDLGAGRARVLLAVTESDIEVEVPRGENRGRRLPHTAVVRSLETVGRVDDDGSFQSRQTLRLEPDWQRDALRAVVFVQRADDLRVVGAASLGL